MTSGSDVWQLAIMIVVLLTAKNPWEKADITDPIFNEFVDWQKRKTTRTPRFFRDFTPRVLRMFRRLMEIKPSKRYPVRLSSPKRELVVGQLQLLFGRT